MLTLVFTLEQTRHQFLKKTFKLGVRVELLQPSVPHIFSPLSLYFNKPIMFKTHTHRCAATFIKAQWEFFSPTAMNQKWRQKNPQIWSQRVLSKNNSLSLSLCFCLSATFPQLSFVLPTSCSRHWRHGTDALCCAASLMTGMFCLCGCTQGWW